jgi:predicted acylesterase/phospholipase RssA
MVSQPRSWIRSKKKVALVLSGGGTKAAAFHIGVAYALRERGFKFQSGPNQQIEEPSRTIQTYVGSSAGSYVASLLASGFSLENITSSFLNPKHMTEDFEPRPIPKLAYSMMFKLRPEIAMEQAKSLFSAASFIQSMTRGKIPSLLQFRWLKMAGIFTTSGLEQFMRDEVLPFNNFNDLAPELFIVANQLDYSRKVIFGKKDYGSPAHDPSVQYMHTVPISQAIAASTALPVLYAPYPIVGDDGGEKYYIDGEIRETLSTHVAVDAGADLVFASYTHQPYRWKSEVGSMFKQGLPGIVIQSIYILIEQKINSVLSGYISKQNALKAVKRFCEEKSIDPEITKELFELLEKELHQKLDTDIIPIHPDPSDTRTFIAEHFTLNPRKLSEIVKSGYRAAQRTLDRFDFD